MAIPPIVLAIAISTLSFHMVMCLYIMTNPGAVASELAKPSRSFLAWVYLSVLTVSRNDPELDLVQTGLPHDAVTANCRRRALMSLGVSLVGIVAVVTFMVFGAVTVRF